MVRLFIRHDVADYGSWREGYDAFDETRRGMGVTGDAVYQAVGNPNDVTVTHDFESADGLVDRAICLNAGRAREMADGSGSIRDRYRRTLQGSWT